MPDPMPLPIHRRRLTAQRLGCVQVLDAVSRAERDETVFRAFVANGTPADVLAPSADGAGAREVSGGFMLSGRANAAGVAVLPLVAGAEPLATMPAETGLFAGLNAAIALRMEEPAGIVAEWLAYHAEHHGLQGAVIVNRAADGAGEFAAALQAARRETCVLVLLESGVPLGKPGMGPESHPYLAPDAPGKDRMTPPAPDPWRAPLGEALIYEIAKWRFLAEARAVMNLDVTDFLDWPDGPSVFDRARSAPKGVIALEGRRIYPWRVRKGAVAGFGDHICRQFDRADGITRWCVAPDVAGLENTWRMLRVSYARPEGAPARFWRAMAIRVPGCNASELAPKTSLVEDPHLLVMAEEVFAHKPVRPPVSRPRAAPAPAAAAGRTAIVTTMKNEGPFILEWLAWHRAIGVDDFLIYSNDCTDGTDALLDLLQRKGLVQHRDNPFRQTGLPPQHAALQAAESEPLIANAGWIICMDVDEFINIHIGDGTLPALYKAVGEANMISLTWRLFGNADVAEYEDRFITEQFTLAAEEICRKPHQAWGFKTLFRNIGIYKKLGVHRPKGLKPDLWDQIHWLNGSGRRMPKGMLRNGWRSTLTTYGYDWVSLNHYALRSAESFLVKRDRGRVNHVDRDQGLNYWFRMNHNAVEDSSLQARLPTLRAEWDRLMADPEIAAAHAACVTAHRARISELRATPEYAAFYAELTGQRLRRMSRMLRHFGSAVFMAGPDAVPPEIWQADPPEDFFFTVPDGREAAQ
jgi:hypothetical protein